MQTGIKMDAFNRKVGSQDQVPDGVNPYKRCVVTDAQADESRFSRSQSPQPSDEFTF
jgi:hypothetical protein